MQTVLNILIFLMQFYWAIYHTLWEFGSTTFPYVDDEDLWFQSVQRHGKKKIVYMVSTSSSRVLGMVMGAKMIGDVTGVLFWKVRFLILLKAVAAIQSVTETRSMII